MSSMNVLAIYIYELLVRRWAHACILYSGRTYVTEYIIVLLKLVYAQYANTNIEIAIIQMGAIHTTRIIQQ